MKSTMNLRDYQLEISRKANEILSRKNIVYLAMEVRTGKTATSLEIARLYGSKRVLFLTKKKAIKSIENDYKDFGFSEHFDITVINDESMHKIGVDYDLIIPTDSGSERITRSTKYLTRQGWTHRLKFEVSSGGSGATEKDIQPHIWAVKYTEKWEDR